jgi:hypothetical protein
MLRSLLVAVPITVVAACDSDDDYGDVRGHDDSIQDELTEPEARVALAYVNDVSRPDLASAEVVDITTDATVGERIAATARRWREFWQSQGPCNDVMVDGNVVVIDFGTLDDACAFAGRTYAGVDTITLGGFDDGDDDFRLHHDLDGFTNGTISLTGEKWVFWRGEGARHVEADFTVTNLETAEMIDISTRHTMRRLDPALTMADGGFVLNGDRSWDDGSGTWTMQMNRLAFELDDPGPHHGGVVVRNPIGRELRIRYSRVDEDTIRAVVRGPGGDVLVFRVSVEGEVVEE